MIRQSDSNISTHRGALLSHTEPDVSSALGTSPLLPLCTHTAPGAGASEGVAEAVAVAGGVADADVRTDCKAASAFGEASKRIACVYPTAACRMLKASVLCPHPTSRIVPPCAALRASRHSAGPRPRLGPGVRIWSPRARPQGRAACLRRGREEGRGGGSSSDNRALLLTCACWLRRAPHTLLRCHGPHWHPRAVLRHAPGGAARSAAGRANPYAILCSRSCRAICPSAQRMLRSRL